MNTLLLAPELFRHEGGIARILRLYLMALCEKAGPKRKVDTVVLNDHVAPDSRLARYAPTNLGEYHGCERRKGAFIRHTLRCSRQADLIVCGHLHQLPIAWVAKLLRPQLNYCLVAHGIEVWRPYSAIERRALLGADRILCVSEYTRRQMLRFCPELAADRLVVVPNTLDPCFVPGAAGQVPATRASGPRILTVGRLTTADTYKGFDTLIEAIPLVLQEFPTARLRVVGTGDDQPRLTALATQLGVGPSVDFLGPISDEALRSEYADCDLFALPSRKEGFGLVYLEAMTHGKPCLGARAGGVPEVIGSEVGTLVTYGDIPELAAAIAELVHHPRDSAVVRHHAEAFAFPAFQRRLVAALS